MPADACTKRADELAPDQPRVFTTLAATDDASFCQMHNHGPGLNARVTPSTMVRTGRLHTPSRVLHFSKSRLQLLLIEPPDRAIEPPSDTLGTSHQLHRRLNCTRCKMPLRPSTGHISPSASRYLTCEGVDVLSSTTEGVKVGLQVGDRGLWRACVWQSTTNARSASILHGLRRSLRARERACHREPVCHAASHSQSWPPPQR